jgi:hypothetical protein
MDYTLTKTILRTRFTAVVRGIAVDRAGLIYVVGDREVKVFDAAGALVRHWATAKPGYCVFIEQGGADASIWVGESGLVERFDASGRAVGELRDAQRLGTVTAVAVHDNDVLAGDATARCIRRYDRSGKWLNDIGANNNTRGFLIPNGYLDFRVDASGTIHAANPAKHRVERYTLTGELLGHFGRFGMHRPEDFGGCCNPTNITLLPHGRVAVTEKAPPRMKVYDERGALLAAVGPEPFDPQCRNMSLAADAAGRVYVLDTERLCVLVFEPRRAETATRPATPTAPAQAQEVRS